MNCPKCGHQMVKSERLGASVYPKGSLVCPMNMPYQGCGYSTPAKK